jgi:hypothetical protein
MAGATPARDVLGKFLAGLAKRSDRSPAEVAAVVKLSTSTLNRYFAGELLGAWGTYKDMVVLYSNDPTDLATAERLWEQARDEPKPMRLPATTPKAFRRLINDEHVAWRVRTFQRIGLPGHVQTREYATALFNAGHRLHDPRLSMDGALSVRLGRQERLQPDHPAHLELHAVIDEATLRRQVGGEEVMQAQYRHLLTLAERSNVKLQVVKFSAGAYGLSNGGCVIVDHKDETSGIYLEYPLGGAWVDNPEDVRRFTTMYEDAERVALSPDDTAKFIRQLLGTAASE